MTAGPREQVLLRVEDIDAVVFDMDGVVTDTAAVHAAAWKSVFDGVLVRWSERTGDAQRPFDAEDYRLHVDGKARLDGIRSFLSSRSISLPETDGADSVADIARRKDADFLERLQTYGVHAFPSTVALIEELRRRGIALGVVSASRNLRAVLEAAGLLTSFGARVGGVEAERLRLAGKPEPAVFVEAARRLGASPERTLVVEDSLAGVEAARRGGFALVLGVDRTGHPGDLLARGADLVVADLAAVSTSIPEPNDVAAVVIEARALEGTAGGEARRRLALLARLGLDVVVLADRAMAGSARRPRGALGDWSVVRPDQEAELRAIGAVLPGPDEPERALLIGHPRSARARPRALLAGRLLSAVDPVAGRGGGRWLLALLDAVIEARSAHPQPVSDPAWRLDVVGHEPGREPSVGSWLSVGNGRVGTRGSLEEGSLGSAPSTYVAGLFGTPFQHVGGPELVVGPEWTRLAPCAGRTPVRLDAGSVLAHVRTLDLRQGLLLRFWWHRTPEGPEVRLRSARFASLADLRVLALEAQADSEGAPVRLDGEVPPPRAFGPVARVGARREGNDLIVELQARDGASATFAISTRERAGRLERFAAVARGDGRRSAAREARAALAQARAHGMARMRAAHRQAWRERWRESDVILEGDEQLQRVLRFALYHLISSAEPGSDLASIAARGLSGPGYRGHVFWDTEVFMLPFFIHTHPATARALLSYRYRTLPAARARAKARGLDGALYAWESADTGEEVAPPYALDPEGRRIDILTGQQEEHISADVAWGVWRYWEATADEDFMAEMGVEMVLETARFWASRAVRGPDGRAHVERVIGPDEYHEGVSDNAFTNVLARWNLERAVEAASWLERTRPKAWTDLARRLGLAPSEPQGLAELAASLVDGFDASRGLYEQFRGFFGLEDVRISELAERPVAGDVLLGRERTSRAQVVKQADVLMLPLMLPELMSAEVLRANYRYYEPRTAHGSSLSPAVHAAVAARCGEFEDAERYLRMAASVDLEDTLGNATSGLHMSTLGGMWQAVVFGFAGVRPLRDALRIDPRLAPRWRRLSIPLMWRGVRMRIEATPEEVAVELDRPADVAFGDAAPVRLAQGRHVLGRLEQPPPMARAV